MNNTKKFVVCHTNIGKEMRNQKTNLFHNPCNKDL